MAARPGSSATQADNTNVLDAPERRRSPKRGKDGREADPEMVAMAGVEAIVTVDYEGEIEASGEFASEAGTGLSPPLISQTSAWRKERIRRGWGLVETNPFGPRRVRLLLSD
jgi:hypothetical protein